MIADILLVIQIIIAIALVGVILLQRSEGGGLGMGGGGGGGGGGMSGFMTGRATANLLTRTTAILAALFLANNIALAILADGGREARSILDQAPGVVDTPFLEGGDAPAAEAPPEPTAPAQDGPSVPTR